MSKPTAPAELPTLLLPDAGSDAGLELNHQVTKAPRHEDTKTENSGNSWCLRALVVHFWQNRVSILLANSISARALSEQRRLPTAQALNAPTFAVSGIEQCGRFGDVGDTPRLAVVVDRLAQAHGDVAQ